MHNPLPASSERFYFYFSHLHTVQVIYFEHSQTHHVSQVFLLFFIFPSGLRLNQHFCRTCTTIALLNNPTPSSGTFLLHITIYYTSAPGGGFSHAEVVCMVYRKESPRFFFPIYTPYITELLYHVSHSYISYVLSFLTLVVQKYPSHTCAMQHNRIINIQNTFHDAPAV